MLPKRAAKGDIAYNMMRLWQGAVGVSPVDGLVSPAYVVARPYADVDSRFYAYLFRTDAYMHEVNQYSHGIVADRNRLYWDEFQQMPSAYPPPTEQRVITRFLDAHARLVQRSIRAKRRLIELLNEQKQVIIHRAVTRGLDPNVRLKPSGVDWLDDVPEHWEVKKLKHLTRFENGLPFKPSDWRDSGVPIIRIQNLNGGEDFNYTKRDDLPQNLLIQPGELLFAWSGNRGTSFGSFVWDRAFPAYLNQHIFKLAGYSLDKGFFYYLLRAVTAHVEEQTHGIIGLVHITKPELGSILVPVPPAREQEAIAASIAGSSAGIEAAISRARREIDLLREYRTRLIADVVTGKLDVREAAMRLPDEPEELDDVGAIHESPLLTDADEDVADDLDTVPEEAEA